MIKIDFQDVNELKNIKIDFDVSVEKLAEIIRSDIEKNLKTPKSYNETGLAPLKKNAYYKRKVKAGRTKIFDGLSNSKKLMNSVKAKKIDVNTSEVFIENSRKEKSDATNAEVMYYLQEGNKPLAGKREAFGITKKSLDLVEKELSKVKIG